MRLRVAQPKPDCVHYIHKFMSHWRGVSTKTAMSPLGHLPKSADFSGMSA